MNLPVIHWLTSVILSYPLLKYAFIFFGAAFGGEVAILSLAFLAAHKLFSLPTFFVIGFLGTLFSDTLWFVLGKTKTAGKIVGHRYTAPTISAIIEAIHKISRGSHLLAFIFAKFLIGTRVVVILYVSKTNIAFKKFIFPDIIAILIWLGLLGSIGFLAGLGFSYFSSILKNIYAGIGFVILILIVVTLIQVWLKKFFTKQGEKIIEEEVNL